MIGLATFAICGLFFTTCTSGDSSRASVCDVNCVSGCTVHGNDTCDGQCAPGFTNSLDDFTCISCPENCSHCNRSLTGDLTTVCASDGCAPGFFLNNNSCTECPANCLKCSPAGTCEDGGCKPLYNISSSRQCLACPNNCTRCNATGSDVVCLEGACSAETIRSSDGKQCLPCPNNCTRCNVTGSDVVCLEGACSAETIRSSDGKECLRCPGNCEACFIVGESSSTRCTTDGCSRGFGRLSNGSCTACPSQCDRCYYNGTDGNWSMVCHADGCLTQFTSDATDAQCVKCPENCDHCTAVGNNITLCNFGGCSRSFGRRMDGTCTGCQPNCDRCAFSGPNATHSCSLCAEKHALTDSGSCLSCPENCVTCLVKNGVVECNGCEAKFEHLANGTCSACPANCKSCSVIKDSQQTFCDKECEDDFFFPSAENSGLCYPCPVNCTKCSGRSTSLTACSICKPGFGVNLANGSSCTACPKNCLSCTYNNTSKVLTCNSDGCADRYYADSGGLCDGCTIANCLRCSIRGTASCDPTGCIPGYRPGDDGRCCNCATARTGCSNCSSTACEPGLGWTPNDKLCSSCPANCVRCSYDEPLQRLSCNSNGCGATYAVADNGSCQRCPANCQRCTVVNGVAMCNTVGCAAGYGQHKNGSCIACADINCDKCFYDDSVSALQCLPAGCKVKHILTNEGNCLPCPDGCTKCVLKNDAVKCVTDSACESGFIMSLAGDCLKCPDNCSLCEAINNDTAVCSTGACNDKFARKADGTACLACPSDCSQCAVAAEASNTTRCSAGSCSAGLSVNKGGHCQACNVTVGKCTACADFDTQTNLTTCRWCQRGFVARNGTCEKCSDQCQVCAVDRNDTVYCHPHRCARGSAVIGRNCQKCIQIHEHCLECTDAESKDQSFCTKCDGGYEINKVSRACEGCNLGDHPNCLNCTSTGSVSVCTECNVTYGLKDGNCTLCKDAQLENCELCLNLSTTPYCNLCSDGFELTVDGKCNTCDVHCNTTCRLHGAGKCDGSCKQLFTIAPNKTCVQCPDYCRQCSFLVNKTVCLEDQCEERYGLVPTDGTCDHCPANCSRCQFDGNKMNCSRCDAGFGVAGNSSGDCWECSIGVPHCTKCDDFRQHNKSVFLTTCHSCHPDFFLNEITALCQVNPCPPFDAASFVGGILSSAATIFIAVIIICFFRRYKCCECNSSSSSSSSRHRPKPTRLAPRTYTYNVEYQPFEES